MTNPVESGQMKLDDLMLEMQKTDELILITVNGDEVCVFSTLDDFETGAYLKSATMAVNAL